MPQIARLCADEVSTSQLNDVEIEPDDRE